MMRITSSAVLLMFSVLIYGTVHAEQAKTETKPLGPGDHALSVRVGELDRHYIVHAPLTCDGSRPLPVVIMFHGGGGNGRSVMQESGWRQKAEQESFLAVFPEAMPPDTGIPSRFGSNAQIWNDGSKRFHAGRQDLPDVAFVKAMLDDLATRFRVDRQRVYATGFSNGASMAFRVGVELSGRLAAIAPVAGALWLKPQRLNQPVSLYYITGDADPLNPFAGGVPKFGIVGASREMASRAKPAPRENVMAWVRLLGCPPEPKEILSTPGVTTEVYRGERDSREVRFTVLKGHGHAWPGGKSLLPESLVGKASTQFKATDAIWNFFEKQRLMEQK